MGVGQSKSVTGLDFRIRFVGYTPLDHGLALILMVGMHLGFKINPIVFIFEIITWYLKSLKEIPS